MRAATVDADAVEHANEVHLVGRISAGPEERTLPSGDVVVSWRLSVRRPQSERRANRATSDGLECCAFKASVRRTALTWEAGDVVELDGWLQRRFFRAADGAQSRYEVVATAARRLTRG